MKKEPNWQEFCELLFIMNTIMVEITEFNLDALSFHIMRPEENGTREGMQANAGQLMAFIGEHLKKHGNFERLEISENGTKH